MSASAIAILLSLYAHNPLPLPTPEKVEVEGRIREVRGGDGLTTRAVLAQDDKTELVLHGATDAEDSELKRLAGVRVRVRGVKGDPLLPRGNHVRVFEYQITDVGNGVVPRMGHLAVLEIEGRTRVLFVDDDGRAELLPEGYVAKMAKNAGARVWMVGVRSGKDLVPTRFAIVRPAPKEPSPENNPGPKPDKTEAKDAATP